MKRDRQTTPAPARPLRCGFSLLLIVLCVVSVPAAAAPDGRTEIPSTSTHVAMAGGKKCSSCGKKVLFGSKCGSCVGKAARDKARKIGDRAKDAKKKIDREREKRAHPCAGCGKTIRVGQRCASCVAKAGRQKAKDAKKKLEDERKRRAHPCGGCGRTIYAGSRCPGCLSAAARDKAKDATRRANDLRKSGQRELNKAYQRGRKGWDDSRTTRRELVDRTKRLTGDMRRESTRLLEQRDEIAEWASRVRATAAQQYEEAARSYVPAIRRALQDPENQQAMIQAVGTAIEVQRQLGRTKRKVTYHSLQLLGDVPVETSRGRMTLEELARTTLIEAVPDLAGTDLAEEPAAVAAALICADREYFLTEMKIVRSGREHVSVVEAMKRTGNFDASQALEYLSIVEAAEDLANGENPLGAVESIATSLHELESREN